MKSKTRTIDMFRPSTILRVAENTITNGFGHLNHGRKVFAHAYRVEYAARTIAVQQRALAKLDAKLNGMSAAELRQFKRDQREVVARACDLLAAREAKSKRGAVRVTITQRKAKS